MMGTSWYEFYYGLPLAKRRGNSFSGIGLSNCLSVCL